MAVGYRDINNVDFDDLFDPYVQGAIPANTGFRDINNVDLAGRYAPLSYGSKRADVGFRLANGLDVSNLWAAKGTATYRLPIHGEFYRYSNSIPPGQNGSCAITFNIGDDGLYRIVYNRTHGGNIPQITGTWLPAGQSASNFEVRYSRSHLGGNAVATVTNGAAGFTTPGFVGITCRLGPNGPMSGTRTSRDKITVEIRNKTTGTINVTEFDFEVETDGSN